MSVPRTNEALDVDKTGHRANLTLVSLGNAIVGLDSGTFSDQERLELVAKLDMLLEALREPETNTDAVEGVVLSEHETNEGVRVS